MDELLTQILTEICEYVEKNNLPKETINIIVDALKEIISRIKF